MIGPNGFLSSRRVGSCKLRITRSLCCGAVPRGRCVWGSIDFRHNLWERGDTWRSRLAIYKPLFLFRTVWRAENMPEGQAGRQEKNENGNLNLENEIQRHTMLLNLKSMANWMGKQKHIKSNFYAISFDFLTQILATLCVSDRPGTGKMDCPPGNRQRARNCLFLFINSINVTKAPLINILIWSRNISPPLSYRLRSTSRYRTRRVHEIINLLPAIKRVRIRNLSTGKTLCVQDNINRANP